MNIVLLIFFFIAGACMGSFANAAAVRYKSGESAMRGRSKCPQCKRTLSAAELIPILGYVFLGGKCRGCKQSISVRYPLTELIGATASAVLYLKFGLSLELIPFIPAAGALLFAALCDLDTMEIPNSAIAILLICSIAHMLIRPEKSASFALGAFIISVPTYFVFSVSENAVGGGDVKLFFAAGCLIGVQGVIVAALAAVISGGLVATAIILSPSYKRGEHMSFGEYIALGVFIAAIFAEDIVALYSTLIHI